MSRLWKLALIAVLIATTQLTAGEIRLDKGWKFTLGDNLTWAAPGFNDADWKSISPKLIWESQGFPNVDGFAWYRIAFNLPSKIRSEAALKDSIQIDIGMIDDYDQTFLNGKVIGENAKTVKTGSPIGDFKSGPKAYNIVRVYVLSADDPRLNWDGINTLAVRVYDSGGGGGLWSPTHRVAMRDLPDYVRIDAVSVPFRESSGRIKKTVFLRNESSLYAFNGEIQTRVVDEEQNKPIFIKTDPATLPPNTNLEFNYDFPMESAGPCAMEITYTEKKTGQTTETFREIPFILTPRPAETPRINGPKVFAARPGSPFLFRIPATGKRPMRFSAANLPAGLTLDPDKGIIKGVVVQPGDYQTTLTAQNELGESSRPFKIVIGSKIQLTPPMGWNSWNCWGLSVTEERIRSSADAMISSGLADHGWNFINIDDGWEAPERKPDGEIAANEKFGDMKALADSVHARGLKLGIYSSPGPLTCGEFLGSYQHEDQDAQTYGRWGIDYLKYDWCSYGNIAPNPGLEELKKPYTVMREALDRVPRDIVYSLCQYGMGNVWEWGDQVGGNCWRTTGDITDTWESMRDIGFDQTVQWKHAKPGCWNDPDMLVVGWVGWGPSLHPTRLSSNEQYTHISLWALLSSPLLLGCDLTKLDDFTLNLLTNDEVIDISQDPSGRQAMKIVNGDTQVWAKELEDGTWSVGLFNLKPKPEIVSVDFSSLNLKGRLSVRDVWRQKDQGVFESRFDSRVGGHGVKLLRIQSMK